MKGLNRIMGLTKFHSSNNKLKPIILLQDFLKQKTTEAFTNLPRTTTSATPTTTPSTIKPNVKPRVTATPSSTTTAKASLEPNFIATTQTAIITSLATKSFLQPTASTFMPTSSTISPTTLKPQAPTTTDTTNDPNTTEKTQSTLKESSTTESNLVVILLITVVFFCLMFFGIVFWIYKCYTTYPFKIGFSEFHRHRHPDYVRPPLVLWRTKAFSYGFDSEGNLRKWQRASAREIHPGQLEENLEKWKKVSAHETYPGQLEECESSLKINPDFLNQDYIRMAIYPSELSNVQAQDSNLPKIIENPNIHSTII